jgi:hypothetical protein
VVDPPPFVPGLELAEGLYRSAVRPILDADFAGLEHAAGLVGPGSDALGLDTPRSRDHDWGPRCQVFLSAEDCERHGDALRAALCAKLPPVFRGHYVHFGSADPMDRGTRTPAEGVVGAVDSLVEVVSWDAFRGRLLGRRRSADPDLLDWLSFPEQALLELTSGAVFYDGLGTVTADREKFREHPRDVWLYRMACGWQRIAEEEPFVGRTRELGDDLGQRVLAARIARELMRLAFLMERRYAPYPKWLGTAFSKLPCAARLGPRLERVFAATDTTALEDALCDALEEAARTHGALGVTEPIDPTVRGFFSRPYRVLDAERIGRALQAQIEDERIRALDLRLGAVDQLCDGVAARWPVLTRALRPLYEPRDRS